MFIIRAHTLQGMSPKGTFFFFSVNMVPWGVSLKSLYQPFSGQSRLIWQLKNCLLPIGKLLCPTIQWSIKQLNVTIQFTLTHTCTHAQENCDRRINKVNLVTVPKENEIANRRCHTQVLKCRTSLIPFDFMIIRNHACLTRGSGVHKVNSWGTKPSTKIDLWFFFFVCDAATSLLFFKYVETSYTVAFQETILYRSKRVIPLTSFSCLTLERNSFTHFSISMQRRQM